MQICKKLLCLQLSAQRYIMHCMNTHKLELDRDNFEYVAHEDPRTEEAELVQRLVHAARMNRDFTIGGLSGDALEAAAIGAMHRLGLDDASGYLLQRDRLSYAEAKKSGTYIDLTYAVELAYFYKDHEALSEVWYQRESLERDILSSSERERNDTDMRAIAQRLSRAKELEIALYMQKKGFEDIEGVLERFAGHRLYLCALLIDNQDWLAETIIRNTLIDDEQTLRSKSGIWLAYAAAKSVNTIVSESCKTESSDNVEDAFFTFAELIADRGVNFADSSYKLLASKVIQDLIEIDPDNGQYQKWRKKLARHFKWQQRQNFGAVSFTPYSREQIEEALHSLGELTDSDIVQLIADESIRAGKI